jgi:hypothetical protein
MIGGLGQELLSQEVVYEQYRGGDSQNTIGQVQDATEGAITGVSSNTLTKTQTGSVVNLELPQPLGAGAGPTFDQVHVTNQAATRTNLGLGSMAIVGKIGTVANLALTVSNPPTQFEVQTIANKIDELLNAARAANHLT